MFLIIILIHALLERYLISNCHMISIRQQNMMHGMVSFVQFHFMVLSNTSLLILRISKNVYNILQSTSRTRVSVRHGSHWGESLQDRLRDVWTYRMTLASAYVLCYLSAIWLQFQIKGISLRWVYHY